MPRRFDRRPPVRDTTRINEAIRASEVRMVGEDGQQIGVLSREDALAYAQERDLDLVEVAAEATPPVCRALDYSKYKYELEQKAKAARKHQQQINVREIKLRPKIAVHDYETKKGHVLRFLGHRDKVKVTIMFRGRETAHPERGRMLLERMAADVAEMGVVEQEPLQDGRNMIMVLGPSKTALRAADEVAGGEIADAEVPAAEATGDAAAPAETPTAEPAKEAAAAGGEVPAETAADAEAPAVPTMEPADAQDEDTLGEQEALPQDG